MTVRQIIRKIKDWWATLRKHPDLSNTWEISNIRDHLKFMAFLLSHASPQDTWEIDMVFTSSTVQALKELGPEGQPIPLIPGNVATLRQLLPSFDFATDFVHHSIRREQDFLMVSYDNLTCCWVSKRIDEETMRTAAKECGFEFEDTGPA